MTEYTMQGSFILDTSMIEEIVDSAGYSIGYWATSATVDTEAETYSVTWSGADFDPSDPRSAGAFTLTHFDIVQAIGRIFRSEVSLNRELTAQLTDWLCGHPTMDGELVDCVIQVALFGEIVYG